MMPPHRDAGLRAEPVSVPVPVTFDSRLPTRSPDPDDIQGLVDAYRLRWRVATPVHHPSDEDQHG